MGWWVYIPVALDQYLTASLAITLLEQKRIVGVEFDSSDRHPPPRCHPDTRRELRTRIATWLMDPNRDSNMFWLLGPAGVGKSAVAQTVAEECAANGLLGAALLISRSNRCDDVSRIISTLVYQLSDDDKNINYKSLITKRLANDSSILEKDVRSQFRELIDEPFRVLRALQLFNEPLLIILDGLDEGGGREAQCELIQLIIEHVQSKESSLLWLICTRPEWHFKRLLSDADLTANVHQENLVIDDEKARDDVYRFLCDGFDDIRFRSRDKADTQWPREVDFRQLTEAAGGFFSLASAALRFIDDKVMGDPTSQLDTCLKFIRNSSGAGMANPFHVLDVTYCQILADVPAYILPVLIRILCLHIICPGSELSVSIAQDILGLDPPTFYRSLEEMHSVLRIPTQEEADKEGIRFYHHSFKDFLRDPGRSGAFSIMAHYDPVINSARQYNTRNPPVQIIIT